MGALIVLGIAGVFALSTPRTLNPTDDTCRLGRTSLTWRGPTSILFTMTSLATVVFLVQVCSTGYMIGVIWTVQLVHYPLFSAVSLERFSYFERQHQQRISMVVMPFMLAELGTAFALPFITSAIWRPVEAWLALAMLLVVWLATFLVQAPAHRRLSAGFDTHVHAGLVQGNWLRTVLWTARGVLVLVWLSRALVSA